MCVVAAVINVSIDSVTDLHESTHFERNSPWVTVRVGALCANIGLARLIG